MAGDGFVRLEGEPARAIWLHQRGYEIEIEYDREDREDLYATIVEGTNFESATHFSTVLEAVIQQLRDRGISDILRPHWFSKIGVKLIELATGVSKPTEVTVSDLIDQLIDRALARALRRRVQPSFLVSNPDVTPSSMIASWKRHYLGGETRFNEFLARPDMATVIPPPNAEWAWDQPVLDYLRRGFWRELCVLTGFLPGHGGTRDLKAPLSIDDRGLVLSAECRALVNDIDANSRDGCELSLAMIGRHLLRLMKRVDDDAGFTRLACAYLRDQGGNEEELKRYLMEVIATGPRRDSGPLNYPQVITFSIVGDVPEEVVRAVTIAKKARTRGQTSNGSAGIRKRPGRVRREYVLFERRSDEEKAGATALFESLVKQPADHMVSSIELRVALGKSREFIYQNQNSGGEWNPNLLDHVGWAEGSSTAKLFSRASTMRWLASQFIRRSRLELQRLGLLPPSRPPPPPERPRRNAHYQA